jgi:hypothetical protein
VIKDSSDSDSDSSGKWIDVFKTECSVMFLLSSL